MSTVDATVHPFRAWTLDDNDQKESCVGGSYDDISAVTIACAVYQVMQSYSASSWRRVGVFDSTDTLIALIGAYTAI